MAGEPFQPLSPEVLVQYLYVRPSLLINTGRQFQPFHELRTRSINTGLEYMGVMTGPPVQLVEDATGGGKSPAIVLAAYIPYETAGSAVEVQPSDEDTAALYRKIGELPPTMRRQAMFHHFHPGHGVFLSAHRDIPTLESLRRMNVAQGPLLAGVSDPTRPTQGIFKCQTTIWYFDGSGYQPCYEER